MRAAGSSRPRPAPRSAACAARREVAARARAPPRGCFEHRRVRMRLHALGDDRERALELAGERGGERRVVEPGRRRRPLAQSVRAAREQRARPSSTSPRLSASTPSDVRMRGSSWPPRGDRLAAAPRAPRRAGPAARARTRDCGRRGPRAAAARAASRSVSTASDQRPWRIEHEARGRSARARRWRAAPPRGGTRAAPRRTSPSCRTRRRGCGAPRPARRARPSSGGARLADAVQEARGGQAVERLAHLELADAPTSSMSCCTSRRAVEQRQRAAPAPA